MVQTHVVFQKHNQEIPGKYVKFPAKRFSRIYDPQNCQNCPKWPQTTFFAQNQLFWGLSTLPQASKIVWDTSRPSLAGGEKFLHLSKIPFTPLGHKTAQITPNGSEMLCLAQNGLFWSPCTLLQASTCFWSILRPERAKSSVHATRSRNRQNHPRWLLNAVFCSKRTILRPTHVFASFKLFLEHLET